MQPRTETGTLIPVIRGAPGIAAARVLTLALALALVLAGCATTAPTATKTAPGHVAVPAGAASVLRSESGFTLIEPTKVGADVQAEFDNATRLLEAKQYAEGIASLLEVTQSAPAATAPWVDLGIAYSRLGDLDKAESSFKRALELNPTHPVANNELGLVYRRKGQFAAARSSYEKAIESFPELHFARLNLAILCDLYLADLQCALDNYAAYQQSAPDDEQAAMWIADLRTRASR